MPITINVNWSRDPVRLPVSIDAHCSKCGASWIAVPGPTTSARTFILKHGPSVHLVCFTPGCYEQLDQAITAPG